VGSVMNDWLAQQARIAWIVPRPPTRPAGDAPERTSEQQTEAGDTEASDTTERRRAQRGEPTQETTDHPHDRGPDLER